MKVIKGSPFAALRIPLARSFVTQRGPHYPRAHFPCPGHPIAVWGPGLGGLQAFRAPIHHESGNI